MKRYSLPVLCMLIQLVSVSTGHSSAGRNEWLMTLATAAALLSGGLLVVRDRAPVAVLVAITVLYVAQVSAGQTTIPAALAVATELVARQAASSKRPQRAAVLALCAGLLATAGILALANAGFLAATFGALLLAAALVGTIRQSRAARETAIRQDLVIGERLRIARDLHDVAGHGLGAITVQAGAARMAIGAGAYPDATEALRAIETASRAVLSEVRWLVGLLRDDDQRPTLADITALVGNARRSGLDVALHIDGDLSRVPAQASEAAYRITQEALTNVLRHSADNAASVSVSVADEVSLHISDRGATTPSASTDATGHGLQGIRERAAAAGGTARIGPEPDGRGWAVRVDLPLPRHKTR